MLKFFVSIVIFLLFQDTAGSERYNAMSRIYYRSASAAVVCFDLTEKESFERARYWVDELRSYEPVSPVPLCTRVRYVQSYLT